MPLKHVIIVGAGPSGLLLSILLAQHETANPFKITIFEQLPQLLRSHRAGFYGPPAVAELTRAGVIDEIRRRGYEPQTAAFAKLWDKERHEATAEGSEVLATVHLSKGRHPMPGLPQDRLADLLLERVEARQDVLTLRYSTTVLEVQQDDGKAWVKVRYSDGSEEVVEGDYVVGCDGARSIVRKQLFGDDYPGFTWDSQVVATDVRFRSL